VQNFFAILQKETQDKTHQTFIYEIQEPESLNYIVFILNEVLDNVLLTKEQPLQAYQNLRFSIVNDKLYINGDTVDEDLVQVGGYSLLILPAQSLQTHFLLLSDGDFVINDKDSSRAIQTKDSSTVIIDNHDRMNPLALIKPEGQFIYYNRKKIKESLACDFKVGDKILTPDLMIERGSKQWKITTFNASIEFNPERFLEQHRQLDKPQDFPEYRRSPRLNLEVPEETVKFQKIEDKEETPKGALLKAILPPLGMLGVGGLTTLMSGRNPLMMLATVLASSMAVVFTVTQHRTEKKDCLERERQRAEDYQLYLLKETSKLGQAHRKEEEILNYQQPSPLELLEKIESYDSRLYERLVNNKDFMRVSLGTGTQPSSLKVESDYTSRDEDEWAKHVKGLVEKSSQQKNVPLPVNLKT